MRGTVHAGRPRFSRMEEQRRRNRDGLVPVYGGTRFKDPCVKSELNSGIIEIECDGAYHRIDATTLEKKNP